MAEKIQVWATDAVCESGVTLGCLICAATTEWTTLLAVQAGAAATLTGLVFVAVSINLAKVMTVAGLPGRAAESLLQFLQVFFISTVALIPGQTDRTLALEFLVVGAVFWCAQIAGLIGYLKRRAGHPWAWFLDRALLSQLATIPFFVAAVDLLVGSCGAFYWLVPGFIFSFTAGVVSAWVLLVEIHR